MRVSVHQLLRSQNFGSSFSRCSSIRRFPVPYNAHPLYLRFCLAYRSFHNCSSLSSVSHVERQRLSTPSENDPTIYALSTAPGRAAIAIVRVSGPACLKIYEGLCPGSLRPKPRYATLRTLYEPMSSAAHRPVLDSSALVLYFPAPQTTTGEDVLELHVHGGPAIVKVVLAAIPKAASGSHVVRYAEPGEFTRRAFYNNRLDLTEIEALGDSLSAETEQQRQLAVRGSTNNLAKQYESWRHKLLHARGELEALIDFSEDQNFEESSTSLVTSVAKQVRQLGHQIQASIANASKGELLRNGIKIALLGAPNAGKSSLLNRIVGREAAIVSKEAGTTRDVVEVNVDIGGFFCKFLDLAGLRGQSTSVQVEDEKASIITIGEVEEEGIRRARDRVLSADVVIIVLSVESQNGSFIKSDLVPGPEILEVLAQCEFAKKKVIGVVNKSDLLQGNTVRETHINVEVPGRHLNVPFCYISCKLAQKGPGDILDPGGIQHFLIKLVETFQEMTSVSGRQQDDESSPWLATEDSLGASERQRLLLEQCDGHLQGFLTGVASSNETCSSQERILDVDVDIDVVLAAENLRSAANCLARITGKGEAGDVEEVLGVVFEKFCVGK